MLVELVLLIAVGDKSIPSLPHELSSSLSHLSLCTYFCLSVSVVSVITNVLLSNHPIVTSRALYFSLVSLCIFIFVHLLAFCDRISLQRPKCFPLLLTIFLCLHDDTFALYKLLVLSLTFASYFHAVFNKTPLNHCKRFSTEASRPNSSQPTQGPLQARHVTSCLV